MTSVHPIFPAPGLIVSCQALAHEPLHGGDAMAKMARAAAKAGAIGIRTNGIDDIKAIKETVNLPVIGLVKRDMPGSDIFITPTLEEVQAIVAAGADIVALDVTDREGRLEKVRPLIEYAHRRGAVVMADVSTYEEGRAAERLGADIVGTTLSGYTPYSRQGEEPDLELVRRLSKSLRIPVVAEGRIWTPDQAALAMRAGAHCVVVGSAITRPQLIAARFVRAVEKVSSFSRSRQDGSCDGITERYAGSISQNSAPGRNDNVEDSSDDSTRPSVSQGSASCGNGGSNEGKLLTKSGTVTMEPAFDCAIGVDIGGTKINAGLVTEAGDVLLTHSLSTEAGRADTMERITEAVDLLRADAAVSHPHVRIKGIGVGTAGQVDWREGSIRHASELIPGYTGTKLKALLEQRYGLPARVDNDVNALALTELRLGAGRGARHFVCIALGTGVGGAIVADGRLLHGDWGGAGELGHLSVDFRGLPCVCGGRGCLEQYASGTSIARRMNERLATKGRSPGHPLDTRETIALWQDGDPLAADIMQEAIAALGAAMTSIIHLLNPELIIIGGGVADADTPLLELLREDVRRRAMPSLAHGVRIEAAHRGGWSGMIGAALQAWG